MQSLKKSNYIHKLVFDYLKNRSSKILAWSSFPPRIDRWKRLPAWIARRTDTSDGQSHRRRRRLDAMTSHRPYRQGMAVAKAAAILKDGAGKQWDSTVVSAYFSAQEHINPLCNSWVIQVDSPRTQCLPAHGSSSEPTGERDSAQPAQTPGSQTLQSSQSFQVPLCFHKLNGIRGLTPYRRPVAITDTTGKVEIEFGRALSCADIQ